MFKNEANNKINQKSINKMDNDFVLVLDADDPNKRINELLDNQTVQSAVIHAALKSSNIALKSSNAAQQAVLKSCYTLLETEYKNSKAVNSACNAATKAAHDAEIATLNATLSSQCALLKAKYELSKAVSSACNAATKAAHDAKIATLNATLSSQCALLEAKYELSKAVNSACNAATKAAYDAEIATLNANHIIIVNKLNLIHLCQSSNFVNLFPLTTSILFKNSMS